MAPMNKTPSEDDIASTLTHLKLSTKDPQKPLHKPKSKPVADSWDEDDSGSDTETEDNHAPPSSTSTSTSDSLTSPISIVSTSDTSPHPPPPTPASPTPFDGFPDNTPYASGVGGIGSGTTTRGTTGSLDKRPEKTTAVAGRLIAGALGVRAPKRTEEEREFDRVVREKERRRRAEEKEREAREAEERERRKKAVWDD
ncbi:hypothetical protein T440DRAFT_504406 [Plenodomus tracheiphilus IPT5]|uniref:Ubiquitin-like protein smt3 n=1 Tax=Plenodomus tracheiphilus IPT5 TaxID=1408161 RepID=A0A6A7BKE1_9PLEO|nr:hypothetical protein T440DRAFT_504406 [Plenodomus tracheiphilus IPT5]